MLLLCQEYVKTFMQNAINPFLLFCVKRHFSIVAFVTFACLCVCGLYNLVASIFKVFPAQPLHTRDMHDELPPWAPAHKGKTMFLSCKQYIEHVHIFAIRYLLFDMQLLNAWGKCT